MINKKTCKLEKHAEGFKTAQLELCPSICIYRALSIQEFQSALQTAYSSPYIQTGYAHFRDYKRGMEGLIGLPTVTLEVCDRIECSWAHAKYHV